MARLSSLMAKGIQPHGRCAGSAKGESSASARAFSKLFPRIRSARHSARSQPRSSQRETDGSRSRVPDTEAFPKSRTGRDATSGHAPAGLPAGDGRGCSVGRPAPSSTRLPPSGRLTTKKVRLTFGKHSESPGGTTPTPFRQALHEPARPDSQALASSL